ncbi:FYVE, RhoGEF and PH domain-containing protein 4 [Trichoplax sp. H2]|nr:FYVE, RhoGEF and PH domain-containing protein 4 [Trichoplax sp. H2]|eukprot:RDD37696.1 FYVE, RhoGEF and PH domain-containing protein 4 [Trichoplax sp. H2]
MISKFSTSVRNFSRRIISSPASATPQNGDSPTGDDNMVSSNISIKSPISEENVDPRQSTISNGNGDSNYPAVILDETFSIPNSCAASDESSDDEIGGSREENDQHQYNRPKIYKIADELYQTENAYVKGLKLIDEDFRKVIRKINLDKEFVSESDLFSSINQICGLNEGLLKDLQERLSNWDECPRISDIMKTFAPFFKAR